MREKLLLICSVCLSRNYVTTVKKVGQLERLEIKKYCPHCDKHTIHKQSK